MLSFFTHTYRSYFIIFFSLFLTFTTYATSPSYGQLATQKIDPIYNEIIKSLKTFNKKTLPHESKNLRKLIGNVRDYLDIFSFAYPYEPQDDLWQEIRKHLDDGYELIGSFKDLFESQGLSLAVFDQNTQTWSAGVHPSKIQYDQSKLKKIRAKILEWKKTHFEKNEEFEKYLKTPMLTHFSDRPLKLQSKFYWAGANFLPQANMTGNENIACMIHGLIKVAQKDKELVFDLDSLINEKNAIAFHDYRKLIRSIVEDITYFPETVSDQNLISQPKTQLSLVVSQFGKIENLLVRYKLKKEEAEQENDPWKDSKEEEKLHKTIDQLQNEILNNDTENNISETLKKIKKLLVCPDSHENRIKQ